MGGSESQEGRALLGGAFRRLCLLSGDNVCCRVTTPRTTLVVTPRRTSRHALPLTPAVERHTAPCLSGVRAGSTVKQGDCRCLLVFAWRRRNLPVLAQCPTAPRLGTLCGMIHDTHNTRQPRQAPTPSAWTERARSCPSLPSTGQRGPALPVLGRMQGPAAHVVLHNGCPQDAGRSDVDSTRSALCPRPPPDALGSPHRFELGGSLLPTAWRREFCLQARSVGHWATGSVSPMQGPHEAQNPPRVHEGHQP
jgi:hypothetical protein